MAASKAFISWSSGKDSAFAHYTAQQSGEVEIAGLLTTVSEIYNRVAMHGVRAELLDRQVAALRLPLIKVSLPNPCSNEIYEAKMEVACAQIKAQGVHQIVFGDLFLEDLRAYRIEKLAAAGMEAVFPLWKRDTAALAREMIATGIVAHVTCVDPRRLDRRFAGRRFDDGFLNDLPRDVDPCGENGEFHTVVSAGPMFAAPIPVSVGAVVEREGFVFADVIPN
ncbi:MAG TPA: hypothetical protein VGT78_09130 [Rhizomicrobium sp.]|nr:hypothetical protein [Rhizomicrobium sp.]